MARVACSIIKRAGGTVLSPAPQGANAHLWLNDYFAQGGGACTDAVSFHGYLYGPPELIVPLVSNLRTVMLKYGLDGAQLWDTEHSWGDVSWPFGTTQDQRAAWLARYIVLSITSKVTRSIWYMYDSTEWGTLAEQSTERILKPGVAYEQIHKWTLGAVVRECALLADVYQCSLDRPETYQAQIVWNCKTMDGQTARFKPPSGYTQYQTLQGKTVKIALGASVPIGMQPVLIEKLE
jgi:hypothetical protein